MLQTSPGRHWTFFEYIAALGVHILLLAMKRHLIHFFLLFRGGPGCKTPFIQTHVETSAIL